MDPATLQQQQQILRANLLLAQLQQQQQLQQQLVQQQQGQASQQAAFPVVLPAQAFSLMVPQDAALAQQQQPRATQHSTPAEGTPGADPLSVLLGAVMSEVEARESDEPKPAEPPPAGPHFQFPLGEAGPCYVPQRPRTKTLPSDPLASDEVKAEEGGQPSTPAMEGRPARRPYRDVSHLTAWAEGLSKEDDLAEHEIAEALFDLARRVEEPPVRRGPVTRGGREPAAAPVYRDRAERRTPVQYSALDAGTLDDDDEDYVDAPQGRRGRGGRGGAAAAATGAKRARAPARGGRLLEPARKLTKKTLEDPFAAQGTRGQQVAARGQAPQAAAAPPGYYLHMGPQGWAPQAMAGAEEAGPGPGSLQARAQGLAVAAGAPALRRPALRKSALHAQIAYFIQWHQSAAKASGGKGLPEEAGPGQPTQAATPQPGGEADSAPPAAGQEPSAVPSPGVPSDQAALAAANPGLLMSLAGAAGAEADPKAMTAAILQSQQAHAQAALLAQLQQQQQVQQLLAARGALPLTQNLQQLAGQLIGGQGFPGVGPNAYLSTLHLQQLQQAGARLIMNGAAQPNGQQAGQQPALAFNPQALLAQLGQQARLHNSLGMGAGAQGGTPR